MNHNSLYESQFLTRCNEQSRCFHTHSTCVRVCGILIYQRLWRLINQAWWMHGSGKNGVSGEVSCGPQRITVSLLVSTGINFQQLQTTRYYIHTQILDLTPSLEKNKRCPTWSPQSHVNGLLVWGFWRFTPHFPSALFSLAPVEIIPSGTAINIHLQPDNLHRCVCRCPYASKLILMNILTATD